MDRLKRRARRAHKEGFTLIEVMVALGILAAGLLTVAAAQIHAMHGGSTGRHTSEAAAVAHSQLERFQRMDFADLPETGETWEALDPEERVVQTTPVDQLEMVYTPAFRIRDVDVNLKAVDVRVIWDEPKRPGRSLTLSSQIHDDPPTGG